MTNYPAKFYAADDDLADRVGYTAALGMVLLGAAETIRAAKVSCLGTCGETKLGLAASLIAGGGLVAYMYLRKAKVIY